MLLQRLIPVVNDDSQHRGGGTRCTTKAPLQTVIFYIVHRDALLSSINFSTGSSPCYIAHIHISGVIIRRRRRRRRLLFIITVYRP